MAALQPKAEKQKTVILKELEASNVEFNRKLEKCFEALRSENTDSEFIKSLCGLPLTLSHSILCARDLVLIVDQQLKSYSLECSRIRGVPGGPKIALGLHLLLLNVTH